MQVKAIDHLVLRTHDWQRLTQFYQHVLGAKLERVLEQEGLYQLRVGSALIDILSTNGSLDSGADLQHSTSPLAHLCLAVSAANAQALFRHLRAKGIQEPLSFATRYGARGYGRSVYIHDPDGNTLELKLV